METRLNQSLPLVSIGVASYNNARYVKETLDSIKAQDYPNWEVIIVDDCSKDNSVEVIREWIRESPGVKATLLVNEINAGITPVFNKCLAHSKGEFISIVGSDDNYLPNRLSLQVDALQQAGEAYGMCYSSVARIDEHGKLLNEGKAFIGRHGTPDGDVLVPLLDGNFIPIMTALFRRSVIDELGKFDDSLSFEDWEMCLRVAKHYKVKYVPGIVGHYRVHGNSITAKRQLILAEDSVKLVSRYKGISQELDAVIDKTLAQLAKQLFILDSPLANSLLRRTYLRNPSPSSSVYMLMSTLGVKYDSLAGVHKFVNKVIGRA